MTKKVVKNTKLKSRRIKAMSSTGVVHYALTGIWNNENVDPLCNYMAHNGDYWGQPWKKVNKKVPVTCKNCLRAAGETKAKWEILLKTRPIGDIINPSVKEIIVVIEKASESARREIISEGEDSEYYEMDLQEMEFELSVIKVDNWHGHDSYGQDELDKIILSPDGFEDEKELKSWLERAIVFRDALNKHNVE